jgi:gamma-glutamylcyclotransferase
VGEVTPHGRARLSGFALVCDKPGADGSAKANLRADASDEVWGVLYRLQEAQLDALDRFEGGYLRVTVEVALADGDELRAVTYRSERSIADVHAFDWYRALLIEGAHEHGLPGHAISRLEALPSVPDPRRRATRKDQAG